MIIISNEDSVYISWLHRHREGYVLEMRRRPAKRTTVLHRAVCADIRTATSKRTHWTTGQRVKACSVDVDELLLWANEQIGGAPKYCEHCQPMDEPPVAVDVLPFPQQSDFHLTRLGEDIVSCVVEVAVIHLDNRSRYDLTMAYIAKYLSKSRRQLTSAITRLVHDGMLTLDTEFQPGEAIPAECGVFPTAAALRTVPAFRDMSAAALAKELSALDQPSE